MRCEHIILCPRSKGQNGMVTQRFTSVDKNLKTSSSTGKIMYVQQFLQLSGCLIHQFCGRTTDATYYLRLLKGWLKSAFHSKCWGQSVKSVISSLIVHICTLLLWQQEHWMKMHWEVLPYSAYSSDLAPSYFHLFDPLRSILENIRI
jgi:hypothetical protein